MNRHELYPLYQSALVEASDLFRRKNADYGDAWQVCGIVGIFVRLLDKLKRANQLLLRGRALVDESMRDTLLDAANYCLLGIMLDNGSCDLSGYASARNTIGRHLTFNLKSYLEYTTRPLLQQFDEQIETIGDALKIERDQIKLKIPSPQLILIDCANTCLIIAAKQKWGKV